MGTYKFVRQPNQHTKWYQRVWAKFVWYVKVAVRIITLGGITGVIGYAIFMAGWSAKPEHMLAAATDNLPGKVKQMKNEVLDTLSLKCEIKGSTVDNANIIFDSNGKASIGPFMFQVKTVIHYYNVLYKKTITGQEAISIANDPVKSRELASDIIFKTANGVGMDWVNCDKKFGLSAKVAWVKQLEN